MLGSNGVGTAIKDHVPEQEGAPPATIVTSPSQSNAPVVTFNQPWQQTKAEYFYGDPDEDRFQQ